MMLEYTIFSVKQDVHTLAKFLRHVDTQRAMEKMSGSVHFGVGSWEGQLEPVYMMLSLDFDRHIKGSYHIEDQECVLRVPGDTRQPCHLEYRDGRVELLGPMKCYDNYDDLPAALNWTYMNGKYWVC